jgi:hypothetical protein
MTIRMRHWLIALGGTVVGVALWWTAMVVVVEALLAGDCPPTC